MTRKKKYELCLGSVCKTSIHQVNGFERAGTMIEARLVKRHRIDDELRSSAIEHLEHMMVVDAMTETNVRELSSHPHNHPEVMDSECPVSASFSISVSRSYGQSAQSEI